MKLFKSLSQFKIKKWNWWVIATVILIIFIMANRLNIYDTLAPVTEGAVGNQAATAITGVNPLGNVYTMVNTVTEPDGTIVTDTLDTDGNYVTTVYNSSSVNMSQATPNPANPTPAPTTNPNATFTEIKQQRNVFNE